MHYADLLLRTDVRLAESPFFLANLAVVLYTSYHDRRRSSKTYGRTHSHTILRASVLRRRHKGLSRHICYWQLSQDRPGVKMKLVLWILVSVILTTQVISADISEYFLTDPYDQLDLFRQQTKLLSKNLKSSAKSEDSDSQDDASNELLNQEETRRVNIADSIDADALEDYYDYLYDIGALPEKPGMTTTTTTTTAKPAVKTRKGPKRPFKMSSRRGHLQVGADVLARVKKPSSRTKTQKYQSIDRSHRDNIAMESHKRMGGVVHQKKPMMRKQDKLPGLENVERLIPGLDIFTAIPIY